MEIFIQEHDGFDGEVVRVRAESGGLVSVGRHWGSMSSGFSARTWKLELSPRRSNWQA